MKKQLLLLVLAILPLTTWAYDALVDGIYYNLSGTEATVTYATTNYNSYSGDVSIPAAVTYDNVQYSVTSIGRSAFSACTGLTSIEIPSSVTSIGNYAFDGCSNLTKVTINCNSIVSATNYGKNLGTIFGGQVSEYVLGDKVTSIGSYAFYACIGLTSIVIPSSVTVIGDLAFYGCTSLTSIEIPNSVTSIRYAAFGDCTGLTKVIASDIAAWCGISFNSSHSNPLYCAKHLYSDAETEITHLVVPSSVTCVGSNAFYNCEGLTEVDIPSSVTGIGSYAFLNCTGLTSIEIPSSVTNIGNYAFSGCAGLTSIVVEDGNDKYDSRNNCDAIIETGTNTLVTGCQNTVIPSGVTTIGSYAFYGCIGLTSIVIPSSVTGIGDGAFSGCTGLTSIEVSSGVTWVGRGAFYNTGWYNNLPDGIVYTGKWLYGFKGEMPENTSVVVQDGTVGIGDAAFSGCTGLSSIVIPNSVTSIVSGAFSGCTGLTKVTIDSDTIVSATYTSNKNLGTIFGRQVSEYVLGNEVTSIGNSAFVFCSGLTSIDIPASVTSIGSEAFEDCTSLTSIVIPNSVTSIGEYNQEIKGETNVEIIPVIA